MCRPVITFSSTVISEKMRMFWNVRPSQSRAPVGRQPVEGLVAEAHAAGAGGENPGDEVEQGGLAGAVRADQAVDGAGLDREVDGIDRDEAWKRRVRPWTVRSVMAGQPVRAMRQGRMPRGMKRTASTMIRPFTIRRKSASGRSTSGSRVRMVEPSTGASGEPMPPRSA